LFIYYVLGYVACNLQLRASAAVRGSAPCRSSTAPCQANKSNQTNKGHDSSYDFDGVQFKPSLGALRRKNCCKAARGTLATLVLARAHRYAAVSGLSPLKETELCMRDAKSSAFRHSSSITTVQSAKFRRVRPARIWGSMTPAGSVDLGGAGLLRRAARGRRPLPPGLRGTAASGPHASMRVREGVSDTAAAATHALRYACGRASRTPPPRVEWEKVRRGEERN
jgi:hypothetical protein